MSPPKFVKVVGYSSEDGQFPAKNLITSKGKWRCKEDGEKQAWVILEIQSLINISHVDIGNAGSAFIEVQVGRVGMEQDKFSVLLPSSSFMGPEESRSGLNETRVRMFSSDKLNQAALKQKWNLVKVICSQPFNKRTKYGISFIALSGVEEAIIKTPEKTKDTPPTKLGAFKLKDDADEDFSVGTYFQHRKDSKPSASAELRSDRTLASLALQSSAKEEERLKELKAQYQNLADNRKQNKADTVLPRRDLLPGEDCHVPENNKNSQKLDKHTPKTDKRDKHESRNRDDRRDRHDKHDKHERKDKQGKHEDKGRREHSKDSRERERSRERHRNDSKNGDRERSRPKDGEPKANKHDSASKDQEKTVNREELKKVKSKKYAPFDELMKGVTFVISGFQNPLRGEIRSKACKMGARYKADWDGSCTHLICAFANTPKFNQVKGKGRIVKKEWIEDSYELRKRLNWKKFSLTKSADEESEEEILEGNPDENRNKADQNGGQAGPSTSRNTESPPDPEEENTDDEIERVMRANKVFEKNADVSSEKKDYHLDEDTDDEIRQAQQRIEKDEKKKHKKKKIESDGNSSDEDSEEKENRKRKKKSPHKKEKRPKTDDRNNDGSLEDSAYEVETDAENSDDAYSAQTDVDEDNVEDMKQRLSKVPLQKHPQIFEGEKFLLKGLSEEEQNLLERYIVCHGGDVLMYNSNSVKFIITKSASSSDIRDAKTVNPKVKVLHPDWVFRCCDKGSLADTSRYLL